MGVLFFFSGLVNMRMRVGLITVLVLVFMLDVLMLVGRVRMFVRLSTVLVLVLMGLFVGVLGHRVPYCPVDLTKGYRRSTTAAAASHGS